MIILFVDSFTFKSGSSLNKILRLLTYIKKIITYRLFYMKTNILKKCCVYKHHGNKKAKQMPALNEQRQWLLKI